MQVIEYVRIVSVLTFVALAQYPNVITLHTYARRKLNFAPNKVTHRHIFMVNLTPSMTI